MAKGDTYRLSGLLLDSAQGLVLQVEGGGFWALEAGRKAKQLVGLRVNLEGVRTGFNLIDVRHIEQA